MDYVQQVKAIERTRPDPKKDPEGFREANDRMTEIIDRARESDFKPRKVV